MEERPATTESVPTHYNGTLYRSRLEARYAVFFDAAGIPFEYEPHSLLITGPRRGEVTSYLPDFYLPQSRQYAEVKGFCHPDAFERIMRIARALTANGYSFAVLGDLPTGWDDRWPCEFRRVADGSMYAVPWSPDGATPPRNVGVHERNVTARLLLDGLPVVCPEWSEAPLRAATFARFPTTEGPRDVSLGWGRRRPA